MATMTSWHKVAVGSTAEQVRTLLGNPNRTVNSGKGSFTWSYGVWPLFGSVTFENDKVVSITLPPKPYDGRPRRPREGKVKNHDADKIRRLLF